MSKREYDIDIFMPLYMGDFFKEIIGMSTYEIGAYTLLSIAYWLNQGPIRDDATELAHTCRVSIEEFNKMRPALERRFEVKEGLWWHKQLDHNITDAMDRKQKARYKAKKAADARWRIDKGDEPELGVPDHDVKGKDEGQPLSIP